MTNTCVFLVGSLLFALAASAAMDSPALYEVLPNEDVSAVPDCKDPGLLGCVKVKVNEAALGAKRVSVTDRAGAKFVMDKKEGTEQSTGDHQSVSYENSDGGYRTMTLTWSTDKATGAKKVSASINLPENRHLEVASCLGSCHVLKEKSLANMLPD